MESSRLRLDHHIFQIFFFSFFKFRPIFHHFWNLITYRFCGFRALQFTSDLVILRIPTLFPQLAVEISKFLEFLKDLIETRTFWKCCAMNINKLYFWNQHVEICISEFFENFETTFFEMKLFPLVQISNHFLPFS